ncbi:MAG: hypothetical protein EXS41_06490 [Opitutaceae bacterium]|nr:hypothetical protein [Opitutaceae bacterium]
MKITAMILRTAAWLMLSLVSIHGVRSAETAAAGTLEGRVTNPGGDEYLERARVTLVTGTTAVLDFKLLPLTGPAGNSIEPGAYNWRSSRVFLDILGEYSFTRNLGVYFTLRNVGDTPDQREIEGPSTPSHAQFRSREQAGSLWTFGVKGTFRPSRFFRRF